MGAVVFLNGSFFPLGEARVSVLDRGLTYGDGLFETLRAYQGTLFRAEDHLDRLFRGAEHIGLDLPGTRGELQFHLDETLRRNEYPDAIVRLTVTRGEADPGLSPDPSAKPTFIIHARPFRDPPQEWYREGVPVSLLDGTACGIPGLSRKIKSCNFLSHILARMRADEAGSVEAILLDPGGGVTEGTTSNLFIVGDGQLRTPPLSEYVLDGITRKVVLELAGELAVPAVEQTLTREDVYAAEEVFLTNTGWEILPVSSADGKIIGDGQPGEATGRLHREFQKTARNRPGPGP